MLRRRFARQKIRRFELPRTRRFAGADVNKAGVASNIEGVKEIRRFVRPRIRRFVRGIGLAGCLEGQYDF